MASRQPVLAVVPTEPEAEELADDLSLFTRAHLIPAWETLPFEHISPNLATMARRSQGRALLAAPVPGMVLVASTRAAVQRLSPSSPDPIRIERGQLIDIGELSRQLADIGYERTDRVEARGEFAVRGGILDVFPAQAADAVRIDLFGDIVEDLARFSIGTQRSTEAIEEVVAFPAREFRPDPEVREMAFELRPNHAAASSTWDRMAEGQIFSGMESWMPWVAEARSLLDAAEASQIVLVDPQKSRERAVDLAKEEEDLASALSSTWGIDAGEHPPLFLNLEGAFLEMPTFPTSPADPVLETRGLDATPGDPSSVAMAIDRLSGSGSRSSSPWTAPRPPSGLLGSWPKRGSAPTVIANGIHRGFVAPGLKLAVLGEQEIAGRRRAHRSTSRRAAEPGVNYSDLTTGDYVVHHRHGIGRFEGLVSQTMAGVERDYLIIAYAGEDRLYVPTDQLAAVQKYTGGEAPRVSRMGGKDWNETKERVRKAVAAVAEQVVRLHRARARAEGSPFPSIRPGSGSWRRCFPSRRPPTR